MRFYPDLIHHLIDSIHHLFHLYHFISQNNLQFHHIIDSSEISNGIYDIDDVWNQSDDETGTGKKRRNSTRTFLGDDDKILVVSRKSSNEQKHDFPHHQRKLNVSLNIRHEENTKTIDYFLVD